MFETSSAVWISRLYMGCLVSLPFLFRSTACKQVQPASECCLVCQQWRVVDIRQTQTSHPLFHSLDDEAQIFRHLLFVQVLLFTSLHMEKRDGSEPERFRVGIRTRGHLREGQWCLLPVATDVFRMLLLCVRGGREAAEGLQQSAGVSLETTADAAWERLPCRPHTASGTLRLWA